MTGYSGQTNGQRTTGRSLSTGRGATATAFARRASRRLAFFPGYFPSHVRIRVCLGCRASLQCHEPGRSGTAHAAATACGSLKSSRQRPRPPRHTLLVVVGGSCSRVLGIVWLCLIACRWEVHQQNVAAMEGRAMASAIAQAVCHSPFCRLWIKPSVPLVVEEITGREAVAIWRSVAWRSSQIFGRAWKPYQGGVWV